VSNNAILFRSWFVLLSIVLHFLSFFSCTRCCTAVESLWGTLLVSPFPLYCRQLNLLLYCFSFFEKCTLCTTKSDNRPSLLDHTTRSVVWVYHVFFTYALCWCSPFLTLILPLAVIVVSLPCSCICWHVGSIVTILLVKLLHSFCHLCLLFTFTYL
jgi:hypothetical protein